MKYKILAELSLLILALCAVSCSSVSEEETLQSTIPEYQLFVVDSFGVEVGDSINMIGSIVSLCRHPNGSVYVLDIVAGCLRVIPENGNAFRVLRKGGGPGELQGAQGVCALGDGRILINDYMKRNLMTYDEYGNYLGDYFASREGGLPMQMWAVDSSSIVGLDYDDVMIEGERCRCYYCARYDSNRDPSVMYYQLNCEVLSYNEVTNTLKVLEAYADRSGHVYIVQDFTEYSIDVYKPDGSLDYRIEVPAGRLAKSDEQILAEIEEYEEFAVHDATYPGGYQPSMYQQLISISGVDSHGNLWVERFDCENGYHLDIWDAAGTLVATAILAGNEMNTDIRFFVDDTGIIAAVTDPEDYPRIYYLEIGETMENDQIQ